MVVIVVVVVGGGSNSNSSSSARACVCICMSMSSCASARVCKSARVGGWRVGLGGGGGECNVYIVSLKSASARWN